MSDAIGPIQPSSSSYGGHSQLPDSVTSDLQNLKSLLRQLQNSQDSNDTDKLKSELKDALNKLKSDLQGLMRQGHPAAQQLKHLLSTPIDPSDNETSMISPTGQVANSQSIDNIKDFLDSPEGKAKLQKIQGEIKNFMSQH